MRGIRDLTGCGPGRRPGGTAPRLRALAPLGASLILAVIAAACAVGGGPGGAPVIERSTSGAEPAGGGAEGAAAPPAEAISEVTVTPLGRSGQTTGGPLEGVAGGGTAGSETLAAGTPPPTAVAPSAAPAAAPQTSAAASEPTSASANPAVVTLLNTANAQVQAGELQLAAATLERALQIDADSAWIWHRLAQVRLRQGQLDQSVTLASKSNSLAAGDAALQADNWDLIAEARRRQGVPAAAAAAEAQAKSLRRR